MNCENCPQGHGGTIAPTPRIKVVQGNMLRLAIPLTLRTIMKDGDDIEYQDTPFIPSSEHPVLVVFNKGKNNFPAIATMDGNVAIVEERGKLSVGTYDITVECFDEVGQPYRFKKGAAVQVVDTTAEAGIEETIEYEAQTWYLDSAIYLATTEIGSLSEEIDQRISDLFGETEFDANNKVIRFYNKDGSKVLVTVDATPFVADGMVENVYIDVERQVLVVVLNADAGSRMFTVPLYLIFGNYYKKSEVDARIAAAVEDIDIDIDTSDLMLKSQYTYPIDQLNPRIAGKIQYWAIPDQVVDYIDGIGDAHIATTGTIYGAANGSVYMAKRSGEQLLYSAEDRVIFNKEDGHLYTYDGEAWAQVSGSSSGGEGTVTGVRMNGTTHEPTDGVVDLGTVITQHQDISGKANSADLATVATSGSYNDLQDKPNIPAGVTVDSTITQNGTNPVQGGAIYSALAEKEKYISYDDENELLSDTSQPHGTIGYEFENESFYFWDATNDEWRRILDAEDYAVLTDRFVPKTRTVNGKALSSNITLNASDVGAQSVINDLATIRSGASAGATALQPADVSVETPATPDGTFELNVGSDTYTVNLNHEHPEYAPLVHTHSQYALVQVVNGESNLPATLDPKTIYGVKADGVDELEMVVIGGYKFYGGGGGAPGQPVLMQPAAGSTISMGTVDNGYGGSTLDPKSKTVNIKARNITQPISVSVSGTGFSIENSVSQISAADAIAGTTINVLFDGSSGSQGGTLLLQSTDFGQVPLSVDLAVDYVTYEALGAVGLRGSQWIQTDYIANPNTNIKLVTKFTPNSNTRQTGTIGCIFDSRKNGTRVVAAYFGSNNAENNAGTYLMNFATDGGVVKGSYYQQMKFYTAANTPDNTFCNKGTLNYSGTSASFNNKSITIVRQTTTADHGMTIGINDVADAVPMNAFDVDIYSLEITESGTTVRNFIPIKKSGVPGLYDTVHGTFHSSETDTPLAEVATT